MNTSKSPLSTYVFERPPHVAHLKPGDKFTNEKRELCIYLGWAENQEQYSHGYIEMFYGQRQLRFERAGQHVYMALAGGKSWYLDSLWPTFIGVYEEPPIEYDPELMDI